MTPGALAGKRVLVVEDEALIAMLIEDILLEQHCVVLGPYGTLDAALAAAREDGRIDVAVLDVNLRGEKIYPLAEMLSERAVPFFFLSGYGADAVPKNRPDWRACAKPFTADLLLRFVAERI